MRLWSPDGNAHSVLLGPERVRKILKNVSGTGGEEQLLDAKIARHVEDWSPNGRWLVFNEGIPSHGIWMLSMETRKAEPFVESRFTVDQAHFSPDGHWVAYRSVESGRAEVYVRPFVPVRPRGLQEALRKCQ